MNVKGKRRYESLKQAAEWFAKINDKDSDVSRKDWLAWLDQSEENRNAWSEIEKTHQSFLAVSQDENSLAVAKGLNNSESRISRRSLLTVSALSGLGLLSAFKWGHLSPGLVGLTADLSTGVGEVRRMTLPDHSEVWLNTRTALDFHFSRRIRELRLLAGEVFIATKSDPTRRRFLVNTSIAQFEALGTQFSINLADDQAKLTVTEGAVRVVTHTGTSEVVARGEEAIVNPGTISMGINRALGQPSWIKGLLLADNMPLSELLNELTRHHYVHIEVSPEITDLRVTGSFPLSDVGKTLGLLSSTFNLSVRNFTPWWYAVEL